ncbi:MAG: DUF1289 domain-containing protein [Leptospiraceae bacterium]|nr:DUF1289 domain-containing protein [Leptospiraceae bacterium]MCB1305201.1 DUF1289 domain-containing protein [Leptospiraceae bacterium]
MKGRATSPCRKICQLDANRSHCIGCLRTIEEIASWSRYDESTRLAIMRELQGRQSPDRKP